MINVYKTKQKCKDDISLIENYEKAINDKTQTWVCHHRRELNEDCSFAYSMDDLIAIDLYYDRPAEELIFMTPFEHQSMHDKANNPNKKGHPVHNKGVPMSEEQKNKISNTLKGKFSGERHPLYGKKRSEETKKKMSESLKGRPAPNKGVPMSEEQKKKLSLAHKGRRWKLVNGVRVYYIQV